MKKFITTISVLLICLCSIFAFDNQQKIWPTDSEVFKAITQLYIMTGHSLPSQTGPWSNAELLNMMKIIDAESLNENESKVYDYIMDELDINPRQPSEGIGIKWGLDVNYELYMHQNTEQFTQAQDWVYDNVDQKPFANIKFETWPADNFYGYFQFSLCNYSKVAAPEGTADLGEAKVAQNVMFFRNFKFRIYEMDQSQPYRAFVAAGGDHWTMQIGRDRINWGAGVTGNLMMSDNFLYHNMIRFTTFANSFKYTYLMSFFPHPKYYIPSNYMDQNRVMDGIAAFISHRLEGSFLKNRLNFTVTESIMYLSETGLDLEYLNPAMFYHDNYIRGNTNSLLGFELDVTPIKGLNLYAEWCMDDFAMGPEDQPGVADSAVPDAFGLVLGVKASYATKYGVVYGNYEFVTTDPYLYLRDKNTYSQNVGEYGIGYIGAIRHNWTGYEKEFVGYKYGGDAIVNDVVLGFKNYGKFAVEVSWFNMQHGTFDIDTCWSMVGNGSNSLPVYTKGLTTSHTQGNHSDSNANLRDSISYTNILEVAASYQVTDYLEAYADFAYISIKNYKNIAANGTATDTQLVVGLSYSI